MKEKLLEYILEQIPKKQIFSYIIGTNHISEKMIGYEKGRNVQINKENPSFKIIVEYFYRIFAFGCFLYWINNAYIRNWIIKLWENLLEDTTLFKTSFVIVIILEFYLVDIFISRALKERLHEVGFDKRKGQPDPSYHLGLSIFEAAVFLVIFLNCIGVNKAWIIYFFIFLFMLLYITFMQSKIEKKNVISFRLKVDNDDSADSVDMENDIAIVLNTDESIPVNLSDTVIFIKNNDDILLLHKNRETTIIGRKNILYIKIKDNQLRYVNNKWINGDVIHYSE